jgi:hypothetical protein
MAIFFCKLKNLIYIFDWLDHLKYMIRIRPLDREFSNLTNSAASENYFNHDKIQSQGRIRESDFDRNAEPSFVSSKPPSCLLKQSRIFI